MKIVRKLWQRFQDWKDPFEAYKRKLFYERQVRKQRVFAMLYGRGNPNYDNALIRQVAIDYINTGSWWSNEK